MLAIIPSIYALVTKEYSLTCFIQQWKWKSGIGSALYMRLDNCPTFRCAQKSNNSLAIIQSWATNREVPSQVAR